MPRRLQSRGELLFRETTPTWEVVRRLDVLPNGTPFAERSRTGDGLCCHMSTTSGPTFAPRLRLPKIRLAAQHCGGVAPSTVRSMTNSFVTADTRSRRLVVKHDAPSWVGRIGIASRGVIYLLLAYLAFDIARHGSAPTQTSTTGALQELEARAGGKLLLVLCADDRTRLLRSVAALRCCHWCERSREAPFVARCRDRLRGALCSSSGACCPSSASGGASSNPEPWVARVMGWSGGTVAIEVTGAALVTAGLSCARVRGLFHRYDKDLALARVASVATDDQGSGWPWGFGPWGPRRSVGCLSHRGRGDLQSGSAKSVDETLRALVHHPFGAVAIGVIALGLLAFGVFSFFDACLRRL